MAEIDQIAAPVEVEQADVYGLSAMLTMNPADMDRRLQRYAAQRNAVLAWLGAALVEGVDYGRIHVASPNAKNPAFRCDRGERCTNEFHYSKKTLWKSGAEKICGYLNFIPSWPNLRLYEERAALGEPIKEIILRCQLLNRSGKIVGEGVGGRDLRDQYRDINKAMKMAKKSSLVDAVLSTAGLSGIFTQDLEDMQAPSTGDMFDAVDRCPIGPNTGKPLTMLRDNELQWVLDHSADAECRDRINEILEGRHGGRTPESVAPIVEDDDDPQGELTMRVCFQKLDAAITREELDRVWGAVPDKWQAPLRKLYDTKAESFGEA